MNPAEQLLGMVLNDGWTVEQRAIRKPNATGGHFSQGYIVRNKDGRQGYLKALDYMKAFGIPGTNAPLMLQAITQAFNFEKQLCDKCNHLSRIARAIGSGSIVDHAEPLRRVDYLIFELAHGDIRAHLDAHAVLDAAFIMKTLHHVATGLKQLHTAAIAHQDLKPSNVLIYTPEGDSKICDLGRAWDRNESGPYDKLTIAGDSAYAPLDLAYRFVPHDEKARRFGCDLYHLGSLCVFCFARVHMTTLVLDNLAPEHRPNFWQGDYEQVLPYIYTGFELALSQFLDEVPVFLHDTLKCAVTELCNPNPSRRGNAPNSGVAQFSLERYVSLFNRLAHDARYELIRSSGTLNVRI